MLLDERISPTTYIRKIVGTSFVSFFNLFSLFMSFKSQVGLLSKDMTCKVQKVKVKVQKDSKKIKKDKFKKTSSSRASSSQSSPPSQAAPGGNILFGEKLSRLNSSSSN